jgi:hypothetical protein
MNDMATSKTHVSLSFDRVEGKGQGQGKEPQIAILLDDEGRAIEIPQAYLPADSQPGDVVLLTLERDAKASDRMARETRDVQDDLSRRDPGGDLKL